MSHQPASGSTTAKQKTRKGRSAPRLNSKRSLGRSAVGRTDTAGINKSSGSRSHVDKLTSLLFDRAVKLSKIDGVKSSTAQIAKSLILAFVVRFFAPRGSLSDKALNQICRSFAHTVSAIHTYAEHPENRDQSFVKYWTDVLMCKVFGDEQRPAKDDWIDKPLFVGYLRCLVVRSLQRQDLSFVYSLSKGSKRMWPALGEAKLKAALDKHKARLSRPYAIDVSPDLAVQTLEAAEAVFTPIVGFRTKFDRKRQVFREEANRGRLPPATKIQPSMNACLQSGRSTGGATALFSKFNTREEHPEMFLDTPLRRITRQFDSWRDETFKSAYAKATSALEDENSESRNLEVVAIPEPAKFRIITKGDGFVYTALQPLQGQLLHQWKMCPASTMREMDLTEKVRAIDRSVDEPYFCSVDYEAATDLLKKVMTELCLLPLIGKTDLIELAFQSFHGGKVIYPDGTWVENSEGQPMGHPLSFPLLCCINLAVYWTTLDRYAREIYSNERDQQRFFDKRRWQVIVNGDDMLFKASKRMYEIFLEVSAEAGLKASIGKNYLSEHTCMINSQVFRRKGSENLMCRQGYLNLKFVTGASVKTGESDANPCEIASEVQKMFELAPWTRPILPLVMERWEGRRFLFQGFRPNWYVPQELGGLGLIPEGRFKVTRAQRQVATAFALHPDLSLITRFGVPKASLKLMQQWTKTKFLLVPRDSNVVIPTDYLPYAEKAEGWVERALSMERAHNPMALVNANRRWAGAELSAKELRRLRLATGKDGKVQEASLMTDQSMERFRDAQVFASTGIFVPPLSVLSLRV